MISGIAKCRIYGNSLPFLILILFAGLVLRIFLSSFWTYQPDFSTWMYWARGIKDVGFSNFYDKYWCDYMPGYLYVLWFLQQIHTAFQQIPLEILFKLPANLSDVGISILIFYAVEKMATLRIALLSSTAYFFNPASLSNSVFWGQIDSFHALPILLSVLFVLEGRFFFSGIFAAVAFMIKPQSLVVFPVLGVVAARPIFTNKNYLMAKSYFPGIKVIVALIISMLVLTIPFIADKLHNLSDIFVEPVLLIKQRFDLTYSQYKFTSLNAFNFWGMLTMWKSDQIQFMNITYQSWGIIIFAIIYSLIFGLLFRFAVTRKSEEIEEIKELNYATFYGVTLILFALFLFITRAHERHFLPTIVFFTIVAFVRWEYWLIYCVVSLTYVLNLLYAYFDLMHKIEHIPPASFQVIVERFIPVLVTLVLFVFTVLSVNFWRLMTVDSYFQRLFLKRGG